MPLNARHAFMWLIYSLVIFSVITLLYLWYNEINEINVVLRKLADSTKTTLAWLSAELSPRLKTQNLFNNNPEKLHGEQMEAVSGMLTNGTVASIVVGVVLLSLADLLSNLMGAPKFTSYVPLGVAGEFVGSVRDTAVFISGT